MKGFAIICMSIVLCLFSSCAFYIVGDDSPREDDKDTLSITITHGIGSDGQPVIENGN